MRTTRILHTFHTGRHAQNGRNGIVPPASACSLSGPLGTMDAAKSEATRTADRANGRHMARVSPPTSSEERKRLMSIMPAGSDPAYPAPRPSLCPKCGLTADNGIVTHSEITATATYCDTAGHLWAVIWPEVN